MAAKWQRDLEKYWLMLEHKTKTSLNLIKEHSSQRKLTFNDNFEEYFIRKTNDRYNILKNGKSFIKQRSFLFRAHSIPFAESHSVMRNFSLRNNCLVMTMMMTILQTSNQVSHLLENIERCRNFCSKCFPFRSFRIFLCMDR